MVVDDHTIFREGLISLLKQQPDFEVVGEAGLVKEAIEKAINLKPDLILMDIGLPDGNGLDATRQIVRLVSKTSVVILTILESDELLFEAFHAGARGYLLKNTSITKLIASLHGLQQGEAALSRKQTSKILDEFYRLGMTQTSEETNPDMLTHRELQVLEFMAAGASNLQIAEELFISENTVKNHVHSILGKLKLKSRHEVVGFARRQQRFPTVVNTIISNLFFTLILLEQFLSFNQFVFD
jgi:DNA-binding NarL/FixJ family response regulator